MKRRVVVTGLGAITPLGIGVEPSWQSLCRGKSGISKVSRFDASNFRTRIAGEVNGFNPLDFADKKLARRGERFILFAIAASRMALEDSRLTIDAGNTGRVGVSLGTAAGGVESLEKIDNTLLRSGKYSMSPFFMLGFLANMAAGQTAIEFGARGPNVCTVTACASGAHAIGNAFRVVQQGDADVMITGGTDAGITPVMFAGLDAMKATSTRNEEPEKASRPFDKDRDGLVTSEGSGIIILEEREFALSRGARIYAELLGYGFNSDAYHIVAPDPDGRGASRCMEIALNDAGISAEKIDYINAHGTSTPLNDLCETRAIKRTFQEYSRKIPVSSNKSMIGHLWGAAGAVEAIFSILTITHGIIPPTINYETPDPECDLDYVPNVARTAVVNIVLSNSFGFGSTNATLIFGRFSA